jgi:uncharacterized protein (TIGR02246 family)
MDKGQAIELVERQARAWEKADAEAVVADFAEDAVLISPGGRSEGKAAIRDGVIASSQKIRDVQVEITRVLIDGDEGAVEWRWSETRLSDGQRYSVEDAIIFVLRDDKIIYWREYFDTGAPTWHR